jgi:selenium metabolism protein YedF
MKNKVILVASDQFGKGDEGLGQTVMETFFVLLKQKEEKPAAIFCVNRGVFLLTNQSLVAPHLKELSDAGVPVLACKTCVDFYQLEDQLYTGEISGMNHFLELASKYEVFTLS